MSKEYRGVSERGDFHEALQAAIATAKESLPSSLVGWELVSVRGENGGFIQVNSLEVLIRVTSPEIEASEVAYFEVIDSSNKPFIIMLVEAEKIAHARKVINGTEKSKVHVQGLIVKSAESYNPNWSFHLEPSSIGFFEFAIEVCDAAASLVEEDLDSVGGAFPPASD